MPDVNDYHSTENYGLPYPGENAPIDTAGDFQKLAVGVDNAIGLNWDTATDDQKDAVAASTAPVSLYGTGRPDAEHGEDIQAPVGSTYSFVGDDSSTVAGARQWLKRSYGWRVTDGYLAWRSKSTRMIPATSGTIASYTDKWDFNSNNGYLRIEIHPTYVWLNHYQTRISQLSSDGNANSGISIVYFTELRNDAPIAVSDNALFKTVATGRGTKLGNWSQTQGNGSWGHHVLSFYPRLVVGSQLYVSAYMGIDSGRQWPAGPPSDQVNAREALADDIRHAEEQGASEEHITNLKSELEELRSNDG